MASTMSQSTRDEYLQKMRLRYAGRGTKLARSKLVDEFCEVTGHERKYAIKLLRGRRCPAGRTPRQRGRAKTYDGAVVDVLYELWRYCEQPCGKRLKGALELWVPAYERRQGPLEASLRAKVLQISPAQIDRILAPRKVGQLRRAPRTPKANAAIKALVPIRAEAWDAREPGWLEADTVAHCGGDMGESFIWSLCATDIYSGWTEVRPAWNRGQHGVCEAFAAMERQMPFAIRGVDTDNGGEFLNHHLHSHFKQRAEPVQLTRSRPYHKNDQAHVEQKNDTHVRQLLGYDRLGYVELVGPMFTLLEIWSLWRNLFCPTLKQIEKRREGSKLIRRHEARARTPCERLMEYFASHGEADRAEHLQRWRAQHDPFEIKDWIEGNLRQLWTLQRALSKADEDGEADLEEVAAAILGDNLRCAPIVTQNPEHSLPSTTNPNQDAAVFAIRSPKAA